MSNYLRLALVFCILQLPAVFAEDAAELRAKGITALKESQVDSSAIVNAARYFAKASAMFSAANDEENAVEMNSFLYWCKKKMTLKDIEEFTKSSEPTALKILQTVEAKKPVDEPATWLTRAEKFADANPKEHLLISIRFFEVADRFKGTQTSMLAMDRSLKEMQEVISVEKSNSVKIPDSKPVKEVGSAAKLPAPSTAELKSAEAKIREIFKEEYAKKDPTLATKLLKEGRDTKNEPSTGFVLLRDAALQFALLGEAKIACSAVDDLAKAFQFDAPALKSDVLSKTLNALTSPEKAKELYYCAQTAVTEAIQADSFDNAIRAASVSDTAARKLSDARILTQAMASSREVQEIKAEFQKLKVANETIATKPDDPDANLAVGSYLCFAKNDWVKGLPLLAKGKDEKLKQLALKDLAAEKGQRVEIGDAWWDYAEKLSPSKKKSADRRAIFNYFEGYDNAAGMSRIRVDKRLSTVPALMPSLVIWNTRNSYYKNIGVTEYTVTLYNDKEEVWSRKKVPCDWKAEEDISSSQFLPPIEFTRVRIDVTKTPGDRAAIAEVQVMRDGFNEALGCVATCNDYFENMPGFKPSGLTDGITTAKVSFKGIWAAWHEPAWVEIDLKNHDK